MPKINGLFFSTDREIQNLKPQDKRYSVKDKLNNGLFIEVKESGIKNHGTIVIHLMASKKDLL